MSFGKIIKKLRRDADMTQERLAELLSISPQAVSRWETDLAMPDIALLAPIANLFGVTTDTLLEMDGYEKNRRRATYDEAFHEYWKHDDKEKNYQIALHAAAEYPGDLDYLEWLASAEYYAAFLREDDAEYRALLEKSAKHYAQVVENVKDRRRADKALHGIVLDLHYLGRDGEAREYAMRQEDEEKRDELLSWCLEGAERRKLGQKLLERKLNAFIFQLSLVKTPAAYDAVEQILAIMFPDGNYQFYHNTLQYNCMYQAEQDCARGEYDEALSKLQAARRHGVEMTKLGKKEKYTFSAPFFGLLELDKPERDSDATDLDDFVRCLQSNDCFDPLRGEDEFKRLLEK